MRCFLSLETINKEKSFGLNIYEHLKRMKGIYKETTHQIPPEEATRNDAGDDF